MFCSLVLIAVLYPTIRESSIEPLYHHGDRPDRGGEGLTTNMRHAVRNRERAAIGGGIFTPDELAAALPAIVAAPAMRQALDELLRVTLDAMMADGIALTEQETAATIWTHSPTTTESTGPPSTRSPTYTDRARTSTAW